MRVRDSQELRRWRQRRGLSQRDLAYLCRCSQATISLLERGTMTGISEELALMISTRLQVPWEALFDPGPLPAGARPVPPVGQSDAGAGAIGDAGGDGAVPEPDED